MPRLRPSPTDPIIAELQAERQRRGLSLQAIGEALGRSTPQTVWQWESETTGITLANLRAWAGALDRDVVLVKREAVSRG